MGFLDINHVTKAYGSVQVLHEVDISVDEGEFLVLVGAFKVSFWLALLGSLGMVLGAVYMLYLYRRVIFGQITRDDLRGILDLSPREVAVFTPLIFLTLWMGIYPTSFTQFFDATVNAMVERHAAVMTATRLAEVLAP